MPTANRFSSDTRDILENVYEVFDGDLNDTHVVVDIGSNISGFSIYAVSLGAKKFMPLNHRQTTTIY